MRKVAIIGAGISGLTSARILNEKGYEITVFEKFDTPGGLIRCTVEDGNLFHRVGGHVFNSRLEYVKDWFWSNFDSENEFHLANRKAKIYLNGNTVNYPIENNLYQLPEDILKIVINDLMQLPQGDRTLCSFESFLKNQFGETLYKLYFEPYNKKIWNFDLNEIPLPWLDGKLPMPTRENIFFINILKKEEKEMVHSQFYYPIQNGSSYIANRLAEGINIEYCNRINQIERIQDSWIINNLSFDVIVYTGDVRQLHQMLRCKSVDIENSAKDVANLPSNGTSNVLCYTDKTNLSWLYLPDSNLKCHRIIYTGNFSPNNNAKRKTCTVEFSGKVGKDEINETLKLLPGNLVPIAYNYEPNSYVVQQYDTREKINKVKEALHPFNFFLIGRFAEWEYYNMDMAIDSAIRTLKSM